MPTMKFKEKKRTKNLPAVNSSSFGCSLCIQLFFWFNLKGKQKLFTITAAVAHFFIFCLYFNFIYMKEFYNLAFISIEGRCRVIDAFITCIFCMSINFQYAAIHTIHMSTTLFFIIAIQSIYLNRLTYLKCFRFW